MSSDGWDRSFVLFDPRQLMFEKNVQLFLSTSTRKKIYLQKNTVRNEKAHRFPRQQSLLVFLLFC